MTMIGGRGLEANEPKFDYASCHVCNGEGCVDEFYNNECIWVECKCCNGTGKEYIGQSGEPEDYIDIG